MPISDGLGIKISLHGSVLQLSPPYHHDFFEFPSQSAREVRQGHSEVHVLRDSADFENSVRGDR